MKKHLKLVPKGVDIARGGAGVDAPRAYDVDGLPPDLAVEIAEIDQRWQLMVVRDGIAGGWEGDFDSADEALAALQREIDALR
jgi:hypothetical protein